MTEHRSGLGADVRYPSSKALRVAHEECQPECWGRPEVESVGGTESPPPYPLDEAPANYVVESVTTIASPRPLRAGRNVQ